MKLNTTPQTSFAPYPPSILPEGFRYSERYLALRKGIEFPTRMIWWFCDAENRTGKMSWELRHHWASEGWLLIEEIDPIPFARNGDLAAYFDGNDDSGDPNVVVVDLGNRKGSYKLDNFAAWLDQAITDSETR